MSAFRRYQSEAGGALVELAIALPVLVLVFAATIDFGRVFYTAMALTDAARAGAQYGALNSATAVDLTGMESAATTATNTTGITAVASTSCFCATDDGAFDGVAITCKAVCGAGKHQIVTVTVTTSKTFTTVMTGFPSIPGSVNLSRTATMRVRQ